ncbi:MAG TPA: hypothetical protein VNW97_10935 [Candidatus Saccharimonadales bacterium]|nr:hypothetical protein [Candidatus Saccharimonadales bacterium]
MNVARLAVRLMAITFLLIDAAAAENNKTIGHSKIVKLNIRPYPCIPDGAIRPPQPQLTCAHHRQIRTVGPTDDLEILDGGKQSNGFVKVEINQVTGWAWAEHIAVPPAPKCASPYLPGWPIWSLFFAVATILAGIYCFSVWWSGKNTASGLADEESRKMYHETLRHMVTAAALGVTIIASMLKDGSAANILILKLAAVLLMLAVLTTIATLLEMSRLYENARREKKISEKPSLESTISTILTELDSQPEKAAKDILRIILSYLSKADSSTAGLGKLPFKWLCSLGWLAITFFAWGLICVVWFVFVSQK